MGVIAGTAVALLTGRLLLVVIPHFHGLIPYKQGPKGGNVVSVERQATADTPWAATAAVSRTLAHLMGGLVTGRMSRASHGFNGALVGVRTDGVWWCKRSVVQRPARGLD